MTDIATELLDALGQRESIENPSRIVDARSATALLDRVAELHVLDREICCWWESLRASQSFDYGSDAALWSQRLTSSLASIDEERVFLAITDENFPPWPVLAVDKGLIVSALSAMQFFEYFVFSEDCSWVMFDTHHNSLVLSVA